VEPGMRMGNVLSNVMDNGTVYTVTIDDDELCFAHHVNNQDIITGNTKKFFSLVPDPTEPLFGYLHYHAMLNRRTGRAWLGHAMLYTDFSLEEVLRLDPQGQCPVLTEKSTLVLWEIWVDRVDSKNVDGIVIDLFIKDGENDGTVHFVKNIQKYLLDNKFSSTVQRGAHAEVAYR